jgi:predicted dehydrogenase
MSQQKEKIGWGIIGPGRIAYQFCDCLEELPDAYVAAVGSRSIERSREFAASFGGTPYGNYQEMVNDPNVDIVYVATPHPMHEEHAIMAANAGKAVLCEKPFAVNRAQAERMFAAARKNNVFMMEGLWSRFFPAWQYVREALDSGAFGAVEFVYASTGWGAGRKNHGRDPEGRIMNPALAGGSLLDAGVYSLAAMSRSRGKFDAPKNIYSITRFTETGVDSDVDMMLEFEDGMTAHLLSSLCRGDMEAKIVCEKGIISVPNNRDPNRIVVQKRPENHWPNKQEMAKKPETPERRRLAMRNYFSLMDALPLSQRRMGASDTISMEFPYRKSGFQFEAEVVQKCVRAVLTVCPDVTPEETLMLVSICDEVRRQANFVYPFEKE